MFSSDVYKFLNNRFIFLAAVGFLLVIGALLYMSVSESGEHITSDTTGNRTHVIDLQEEGFQPEDLTIAVGDTVIFASDRGKMFWPASDLHPTHNFYSEFDSLKPIEPNDTWSFTFDKVGEWKFHDHLSPNYRGSIMVAAVDEASRSFSQCQGGGAQCWEEQITETLKKQGIAEAFKLVATLYEDEPDFVPECHSYVHIIGEEGYREFSGGSYPELPIEVTYCGYGFFHGFMETLLFATGDIAEAQSFCGYVTEQFARKNISGASKACLHGFGHGFTDGGDPRLWGSADDMVAPALLFCDKIATSYLDRYLCTTGVYNSIERLSTESQYELTELATDPIAFCNRQPLEFTGGCYVNMIPAVLRIVNDDIRSAIEYMTDVMQFPQELTVNDDTNEESVVIGVMAEFMRLNGSDPLYQEKGLSICRALPIRQRDTCIRGLGFGHIKYGKPGDEYSAYLAFCTNSSMSVLERESCYGSVLPILSIWYDKETSKYICEQAPEEMSGRYCNL